jgi:hypothetical protein
MRQLLVLLTFCFLVLTHWFWARANVEFVAPTPKGQDIVKQELIEMLDRLVFHERQFFSIYGYYTKVISKLGVHIPPSISEHFQVVIAEAGSDRLLVVAFSENKGTLEDFVSVDQDYQITHNFIIPSARADYLRMFAARTMRERMSDSTVGAPPRPHGFFESYFRFEVTGSDQLRAVGVRYPIQGQIFESSESRSLESFMGVISLHSWLPLQNNDLEQRVAQDAFALRIFELEMGRQPESIDELEQVVGLDLGESDLALRLQQSSLMSSESLSRRPSSMIEIEPLISGDRQEGVTKINKMKRKSLELEPLFDR